jgi:hypothetical protein
MLKIRIVCLFSLLLTNLCAFAQGSVLARGDWYKIGVVQSGLHRLDATFLRGLGLNPARLNPAHLRLYGNGGAMLPQRNDAPRERDLVENAIYVSGEQDGVFDNQDYVLFYAQGPHTIHYDATTERFRHQTNLYSDTAYYFLTLGDAPGARIADQPSIPSSRTIQTFDDYVFHEQELKNLLQSGREWYGESFDFNAQVPFDFQVPNALPGAPVYLSSSVMAAAQVQTRFEIRLNDEVVGSQTVSPISGARYDYKGFNRTETFSTTVPAAGASSLRVTLTYDKQGNSGARGFLNFLGLQTRRALQLSGSETAFRSIESTRGADALFQVSGAQAQCRIWDVSDPLHPRNQLFNLSGEVASFGTETPVLKEFVIFSDIPGAPFAVPVSGRKLANQDLHSLRPPRLLIVTHPSFRPQALRLAEFRRSHDGLTVEVASTEEVYNEFASGKQDVTAIRDFVKYLYDQDNRVLQYLLLFGDATYDYKNRVTNQQAFVPVYESRESLHPIFSYSSDDYFGFMETEEGEWTESNTGDHTLEIGVGRLPVRTPDEARFIVDKLIHYANHAQVRRKWRNRLTFVADDGDANTHQLDADRLAQEVVQNYPVLNVDKIYVDAFPQVITPGGQLAPRVKEAINKTVNDGSLIVNYTGHGGESGWAEEKILGLGDILSWKNPDNLPLFVTATCEFGRYDDPVRTSGAEIILLRKNNGGIALLTTTRPVFSNTNFYLNEAFYRAVFKPTAEGMPRLGDIQVQTKNNSLSGSVNRNFSLLGDPSMRLAYPQHEVVLTHLNGKNLEEDPNTLPDTLKALSRISLSGEIRPRGSTGRLESFDGEVYVTVLDKPSQLTTFGTENDGRPNAKMAFELQKNLLFEGKATVTGGRFTLSFIVPKDIDYRYGPGKISWYARNRQGTEDAAGAYLKSIVGGSQLQPPADLNPPVIRLFMNDTLFVDGGTVQRDATLLAFLSDESGINLAQGGIGHEITATLDEGEEVLILNNYYSAAPDTYQKGTLLYPFSHLPLGKHRLKLKAWDVYNNSSEASLEFIVNENAFLELTRLSNYPNPLPAQTGAATHFQFEHNREGEDLEVELEIFDRLGRKVRTLQAELDRAESPSIAATWDGNSDNGSVLTPGLYVYRLTIRSLQDGSQMSKSNKLILMK